MRQKSRARARAREREKGGEFYREWGATHRYCQCCGIGDALAEHVRYPGLSTHHIAKAGRIHHSANLIRLCARCHDLAEGLDTPVWLPDGRKWYYPKLTFAHVLWLKRYHDPDEYDAAQLERCHMRPLPAPVKPDGAFLAEYHARRYGNLRAAEELLSESSFPGSVADLLHTSMQPGQRAA